MLKNVINTLNSEKFNLGVFYGTYCNLLCVGNYGTHLAFHGTSRALEHGVAGICVRLNGIASCVARLYCLTCKLLIKMALK